MAGGRGPSWVVLGSISAGFHILAGAAFFSASPIGGALGAGLETLQFTPIMVDDDPAPELTPPTSTSPKPEPRQPPTEPPKPRPETTPPPPPPTPPPAPPPVPTVKLGVDGGKQGSDTWIESKEKGEHQGPVMGTEQPQLARNPGPGGKPAPGSIAPSPSTDQPTPTTPAPPPAQPSPPVPTQPPTPATEPSPRPVPATEPPPRVEMPPAPTPKEPERPTQTQPESRPPIPPFRVPEPAPILEDGVGADNVELRLPALPEPQPQPIRDRVDPRRDIAEPAPTPPPLPPVDPAMVVSPDPLTQAMRTALAVASAPARPATPPAPAPRPAAPSASAPTSAAGGGDPNDRGSPSDRQSDASSVVRRRAEYRNGRVEAGEGIEIRTVRPVFSLVTRTMAAPRAPLMEVSFGRDGKARNVRVLRSSGYPNDVDEPIITAMYQWRASGRALLELTEAGPSEVRLEITIRLGGG